MLKHLIIRREVSALIFKQNPFNRTLSTDSSSLKIPNNDDNVNKLEASRQPHIPVMAKEVIKALKPESGKIYIHFSNHLIFTTLSII